MTKQLSNENKRIYEHVIAVFGNERKSSFIKDSKEGGGASEFGFDILTCHNSPFERVDSYATIGLSDFRIGSDRNGVSLGVELVGACDSQFSEFTQIVRNCAYSIIENHLFCPSGTILKDIIDFSGSPMHHVLLNSPFGWDLELKSLNFSSKTVAWLLIVPISDAEIKYAEQKGTDALGILFEQKQIDIYDIKRKSVL